MNATIVEFERRSVGIAVRTPSGFLFFSAAEEFAHLDGKNFCRLAPLYRAVNVSGADQTLREVKKSSDLPVPL